MYGSSRFAVREDPVVVNLRSEAVDEGAHTLIMADLRQPFLYPN